MKNQEIRQTVKELEKAYEVANEAAAKVKELEQTIKDELEARETEVLDLGNVIIRWTSQAAERLSTKEVKDYLKSMNVLEKYLKTIYSRRFSIAV